MTFPVKHAYEEVFPAVDWTEELNNGETISSATLTLKSKRTPRDPNPSAMLSGVAIISTPVVSHKVIGGIPGEYQSVWRVVTSQGRKLEKRVPLIVI